MARAHDLSNADAPTGQVVRAPSPGDGIGHALRRTFGQGGDLPTDWQDCLRQLNCISRH